MASIDELWLVDFGDPHPREPARRRPALILGPPQAFGPTFPFSIVAPLTTVQRGLSLHIEVEATPATGLVETSYIQCELLRSVNRDRFIQRIGVVDPAVSHRVAGVVKALLNY